MSHLIQCDRCGEQQELPPQRFRRNDPHPSDDWVTVYFGKFEGDLSAPSKLVCPDCLEAVQLFLIHKDEAQAFKERVEITGKEPNPIFDDLKWKPMGEEPRG